MKKTWQTKLIHTDAKVPEGFRSLSTPVYRGSTVLFANSASASDRWDQEEIGYTYGLYGTPTTLELAARIAELEHGYRTVIAPGGQAAIALIDLAFLSAGDHVLIPESAYGPNRLLATKMLKRFGIETNFYPPLAGAGIESHLRENTRLIWTESPGSITLEVQDIPVIVEVAHRKNILVALDNTWSAGVYLDAFAHGVDVTMQALTKYIGGHSDLLLGSVTARDPELYNALGETRARLGLSVSPDECSLALRGMKTMAVRLEAIEKSALQIAHWLVERPEIETVLHPALPSCPGHEFWKRDFSGSSGVFSMVFQPSFSGEQVRAFVDSLQLFKIGYSWAGVTSLALPYDMRHIRGRSPYGDRLVRLNIGLEATSDLIEDLSEAMTVFRP